MEPLQPAEETKGLKLDKAELKPQASIKKIVLPLGTTEGRGTHYHRYPAHPAKMTNLAASPFSTSQA